MFKYSTYYSRLLRIPLIENISDLKKMRKRMSSENHSSIIILYSHTRSETHGIKNLFYSLSITHSSLLLLQKICFSGEFFICWTISFYIWKIHDTRAEQNCATSEMSVVSWFMVTYNLWLSVFVYIILFLLLMPANPFIPLYPHIPHRFAKHFCVRSNQQSLVLTMILRASNFWLSLIKTKLFEWNSRWVIIF